MRVAIPGGKMLCLKAEVRSQSGLLRGATTKHESQEAVMT
jgi:hypothetical protein